MTDEAQPDDGGEEQIKFKPYTPTPTQRAVLLSKMADHPDIFDMKPGQGYSDEPYQRSK